MIVVNLMGGLGNQMFQYALGVSLAHKFSGEVRYATDFYPENSADCLDIERFFDISLCRADEAEIRALTGCLFGSASARRVAHKVPAVTQVLSRTMILERQFGFDASVYAGMTDGCYIHGYWQNENYFSSIKDTIASKFDVTDAIKINERGSYGRQIGLHIRRGDYLGNTNHLVALGLDYYEAALRTLQPEDTSQVKVFSDDPVWAAENCSHLHKNIRVCTDIKSSGCDLKEMALCDDLVIANSSYSWWAAWLNTNPTKRIIAPKKWFVSKKMNDAHSLPPDWIRI